MNKNLRLLLVPLLIVIAVGIYGALQEHPASSLVARLGTNTLSVNIACPAPVTCVAAGEKAQSSLVREAYVATSSKGQWSGARELAALNTLNRGDFALVNTLTCATASSCAVGGVYSALNPVATPSATNTSFGAFIATLNPSGWSVTPVRGLGPNKAGRAAQVTTISCPRSGYCSAGGVFDDATGAAQAFVVSQRAGTWQVAENLPGLRTLNAGGHAVIHDLVCTTTTSCLATGFYLDAAHRSQGFIDQEIQGHWQNAQPIPGLSSLNIAGIATATNIACVSAGNCTVTGEFTDITKHARVFAVTQTAGKWGTAEEIPGDAALSKGGNVQVNALSCPTLANCTMVGQYTIGTTSTSATSAFLAREVAGKWHAATQVPGLSALNANHNASATTLSCTSQSCILAGYTTSASSTIAPFYELLASSAQPAQLLEPVVALNAGHNAEVTSLACPTQNSCELAGFYTTATGHYQAFVTPVTR